ncbi:MAG: HAMP domain-containing protein [Chloroflexi bacterium]|nr:HAMP domain-containing protein [Chloroflexota bacterium]
MSRSSLPDRLRVFVPTPRGLGARIVLWGVVPLVLIVGLAAGSVTLAYYRVTDNLLRARNAEITRLLAQRLSTDLLTPLAVLDRVGASDDVRSGDPARMRVALRWAIGELRAFDEGVVILDLGGQVIAADPRRPALVGQDWSPLGMAASGQARADSGDPLPFGADVAALGDQGPAVVPLLLPVYGPGRQPLGTIAGLFALEPAPGVEPNALARAVGRLLSDGTSPQGGGARLLLVDGAGRLIGLVSTGSREAWGGPLAAGTDLSAHAAVAALRGRGSGSVRLADQEGRALIAGYAPVPDTSWGLVQEEDWAVLVRPVTDVGRLAILLLALGLLVPTAVVVAGIRRLTRPLAGLTEAAQGIAAGDLGQRIDMPEDPELARLAAAFNHMSARLRTLYDGLERQVADRTRALSTLNAMAAVVSRTLDLDEVLTAALEHTLTALSLGAGLACAATADGGLALVAVRGGPSQPPDAALDRSGARGLADGLAPALCARSELPSALQGGLPAMGGGQVVSVPLVARDQLQGLLLLAWPGPTDPDPDTLRLLAALGQQAGVAAENARLVARAEEAAVSAERNRLARELHDSVTQMLFSANLIAGVLPIIWERDPGEGQERLAELHLLTRGALAEMRALLMELRPRALADTPLHQLLRQLCDAAQGRSRVPIALTAAQSPEPPTQVRLALYRVAQEALNNMARHSGASAASVLWQIGEGSGWADLIIEDNGHGFCLGATRPGSLGLGIMRERAEAVGARLSISSVPGQGTRVSVSWRPERQGTLQTDG